MTDGRTYLGKHFGARYVRRAGTSLYVFGKNEVVEVSLANPSEPQVVSSLPADRVGAVRDLVSDRGHLYLLGDRGLQVTNATGQTVADSIQVSGTRGLVRKDRFAFLVGDRSLEVLDLAPYHQGVPASAD